MFQIKAPPIEGGIDGGGGKGSNSGWICLIIDSKGETQNCFWTNPNRRSVSDVLYFLENYYRDATILSIKSFDGNYTIFNNRGTKFFYAKIQSYDTAIMTDKYVVCAADIEDGSRSTTFNFGDFKSIRGNNVTFYGSIK